MNLGYKKSAGFNRASFIRQELKAVNQKVTGLKPHMWNMDMLCVLLLYIKGKDVITHPTFLPSVTH